MKQSLSRQVKAICGAMFMLAGLLASSNAYAWTLTAGTYYYDNTSTHWDKVYMRIGRGDGDKVVHVLEMSPIEGNLNLYSYTFSAAWENFEAVQFASVDGYTSGIYDGNNIAAQNKTEYIKTDFVPGYPLTVAGSTITDGYFQVSSSLRMPNSVTRSGATTFGGKSVTNEGTIGYFESGSNIDVVSSVTLGFDITVTDYVHNATLNYSMDGTNYQQQRMYGLNHTKKGTVNVTLPTATGAYTFADYAKMGGKATTTETATYHVVGFTAEALNFGSVKTTDSSTKSFSISNVWDGDATATITATISGDSDFSFDGVSQVTKSISVTSGSGSTDITFKPSATGDRSATLTLSMTCADGTTVVEKTYNLAGFGSNGNVAIIKSSRADVLEGPKATLHGYIQYTGCQKVTEIGFYYGTSSVKTGGTKVGKTLSDAESAKVASGYTWQNSIPDDGNLAENTTYYYRPYIIDGGQEYRSEKDYTFRTKDACNYTLGDTVYVNVDKSFAADDNCKLQYTNLENAINFIKSSSTFYNSTTKNLNYNIVIKVAPATTPYDGTSAAITTGGESSCPVNLIQDINNSSTWDKILIIRSANPNKQPVVNHIEITNSKNVVLDNLRIQGHAEACSGKYDNAIDIDMGKGASIHWQFSSTDYVENAGLVIKNCYIYSNGFTCIHVSAYDGILFENNEIEASLPSTMLGDENTNKTGASVKIIHCKDFRFLRNNFRGSHSTSIWAQGLKSSVIMNNVFWNDNLAYYSEVPNNIAIIRLFYQYGDDKNEKLAIYYNTMFLKANNSRTVERQMDFFRIGSIGATYGKNEDNASYYDYSTIRFMYNNCYSYDMYVTGRNKSNATASQRTFCTTDESHWCTAVSKNNFWSYYDESQSKTVSDFAVGCESRFINVAELLCSTAADDPGTLVIKGGGLNYGYAPTTAYAGENTYYNDRLHPSNGADAVRNQDGKWTLGAYQQSESEAPIDVIVWWGGTEGDEDNWDNRYNWRKLDGSRVTCIDNFSTDLKVIIPASDSKQYNIPKEGIEYYPMLPTKFDGERTKLNSETVNAGHGITTPTKFASTIEMEYGAAIRGITALKDDDARRYDEVTNYFDADRKKWLLVGTVVKPFADGGKTSTRLIKSGDYYLNKTPHVYMRQAQLNGDEANWDSPFASLEESVNYDQCFAIKLPDQYGPNKSKAYLYYKFKDPSKVDDGNVSKMYSFNGWFLNDEIYPEVESKQPILMTNTYPANFYVKGAGEYNKGTIKFYNYADQEFQTSSDATVEVKSQNGFIFIPGNENDGYFRLSKEILSNKSTKYKSTVSSHPYFYIKASNPNGEDGSSSAGIYYDPLKSDSFSSETDLLNTVITTAVTKPEVYVDLYEKELDRVVVPDLNKAIPLGLVLQKAMTVEFSYREMGNMESAVLEDRATGVKYDLLKETATITGLAKGTYTGRFFLNLSEEDIPDVPTSADVVTDDTHVIDIYADGNYAVISSSDNVILKSVEITDMAGRTTTAKLAGAHYNRIKINGAQGVYIIKAIGDTKSETTKLIVK